jgi:hypothetical protein
MFANPRSSTAWRSTFQYLRHDFAQAADAHPALRHAVVQALDRDGTVPPRLERLMRDAGGFHAGEMRARWDLPPWGAPILGEEEPDAHIEAWLRMNNPAQVGYLFGPKAARDRFERLAGRAWLALPGTPDGKAQAYPQARPRERWLAFVYRTLRNCSASYLEADDVLWVRWKTAGGRPQEKQFTPESVRRETPQGVKVGVGYPEVEKLLGPVERWKYSALATDPFTASAVAIDTLLKHPDPEGPYLVSWSEMDAYQNSPAFQNANCVVDEILLGEGRTFPIYRYWCKTVPGKKPSVCPNAEPPANRAERRALLAYLPGIEKMFRERGCLPEGQTIHWVGRQANLATICRCSFGRTITASGDQPKGNEGRDQWIYEQCCKGVPYKEIPAALRKQQPSNGWRLITTKQGIQDAARRYARRNTLELPPARQER